MQSGKPPYTSILFVCTKSTCKKRGGKRLQKALKKAMKDQKLNKKRLRIQACGCLDLCKHGPNAVLCPGGTWFRGIDLQEADELLKAALAETEGTE